MTADREQRDDGVDPRIYFAAERTLLAWVRTGLAMMGFGFVVARFGLFLRELTTLSAVAAHQHSGVSLWGGTALVILGVATTFGAAIKHWYTIRRLQRGERLQFTPWSLGTAAALLLGLLGVLIAVYLVFGLDRAR
jgi:putative membrane protein